jgi:hypothetical protein
MSDPNTTEYQALRDTIRQRGTARLCAVLVGLIAWGALVMALLIAELEGDVTLIPLIVLAATFEINFFIHTGVERVGRYIQVFYEERVAAPGWETTAMSYGAKFPSGLDPLFLFIFASAASVNLFVPLYVAGRRGGFMMAIVAHLVFAYRIVATRKLSAAQRALDLDRFRSLLSK